MGRVKTDLTVANLVKTDTYTGQVAKLNYQIKTGDKWNQEGTTNVDFEQWVEAPASSGIDPESGKEITHKRLQYIISLPGQGNHFNDLYMTTTSLGFVQSFMIACGVEYDSSGFDPDDAIGKSVGVEVTTNETEQYGFQNEFKYSKV